MIKYKIKLILEEVESILKGKEISLFIDEEKDIEIFIKIPKNILKEMKIK